VIERQNENKKKKELKKKERHKRGSKNEYTKLGCPPVICYSGSIANYWNVMLIAISDNTAAVCFST